MKLENKNHYKKRNRNLNNESTSNLSQNKEIENKNKLRCNTQDESVSTNLINLNSENIIFKNEDNILIFFKFLTFQIILIFNYGTII